MGLGICSTEMLVSGESILWKDDSGNIFHYTLSDLIVYPAFPAELMVEYEQFLPFIGAKMEKCMKMDKHSTADVATCVFHYMKKQHLLPVWLEICARHISEI